MSICTFFFFLFTKNRFACLNLIALTVFTEMWKRRSNEHAFYFGTYGKLRHKRPRPAFRGKFEKNPITGREEVCTLYDTYMILYLFWFWHESEWQLLKLKAKLECPFGHKFTNLNFCRIHYFQDFLVVRSCKEENILEKVNGTKIS